MTILYNNAGIAQGTQFFTCPEQELEKTIQASMPTLFQLLMDINNNNACTRCAILQYIKYIGQLDFPLLDAPSIFTFHDRQ